MTFGFLGLQRAGRRDCDGGCVSANVDESYLRPRVVVNSCSTSSARLLL